MKTGFIGIGNMGGAIFKRLAAEKGLGGDVLVFDLDGVKLADAADRGAVVCGSVAELVSGSDAVFIGVKPDAFATVMPLVAESSEGSKIIISMAAGITVSYLESYLGDGAKILRIMPNTPALVGEGMTAVCRNRNVSDDDMAWPLCVLAAVGRSCEVAEELMHCVIGVSGSSPAYTYMYIDSLAAAAEDSGMERKQALLFAAQSVLGAARMVLETGIDPEQLRINVCSPGGATIEAVQKLQERGFAEAVSAAFLAAAEKSRRMSER